MPKEIKIAQEVPPVVVDDSEPRLAARRTREPPKDAGQIYGDHPDCRNHIRYFKSLSEWNKHMKKHDRPYKCTNPGCNQRFTQSGVMHRHVREVHCEGKKWMCPYPDCNSSSGKGFKRKGGLDTHIRYVHTEAGRNSLRAQIAQLQREAMQRDSRLDKLERELKQALSPSVRLPSCYRTMIIGLRYVDGLRMGRVRRATQKEAEEREEPFLVALNEKDRGHRSDQNASGREQARARRLIVGPTTSSRVNGGWGVAVGAAGRGRSALRWTSRKWRENKPKAAAPEQNEINR
ncbi:predicted protein [Histoplasma mississippiense (nom. inval.)]|uniref:predicted protein n=1 Tax=Ajellomyces capsulatus (strain NAm1 / WU24) TaxID=2059318 RepID=UPI000157D129|nr:predicted protein [Histoplasma mississippiense (nom. inval.)]EDN11089.1 predicted protein [Histoplasma mississippiense (nom. inval.)]